MADGDMGFLDARGIARRHGDHAVGEGSQHIAVLTGEGDELDLQILLQSAAATTFFEVPLVLMATATSPGRACAVSRRA